MKRLLVRLTLLVGSVLVANQLSVDPTSAPAVKLPPTATMRRASGRFSRARGACPIRDAAQSYS